jgi:predicted DNA-binding transcriptional regulator YafY
MTKPNLDALIPHRVPLQSARQVLGAYQRLLKDGSLRAAEIAQEWHIDERHARTIMDLLAEFFPEDISQTTERRQRILRLAHPTMSLRPDRTLGIALLVARRLFGPMRESRFYASATKLIQDIDQQTPPGSAILSEWQRKLLVKHESDYNLQGRVGLTLDTVLEALAQDQTLTFTYTDFEGHVSQRHVAPYTLVFRRDEPYLIARNLEAQTIRAFTLHSFEHTRLHKTRFTYPTPDEYNPEKLLEYSLGVWPTDAEPDEVRLRFVPRYKTYVQRHRWHSSQRNALHPDGSVTVTLHLQTADPELHRFILGFGHEVTVLSPPALRDAIHQRALALVQRYQTPTPPP